MRAAALCVSARALVSDPANAPPPLPAVHVARDMPPTTVPQATTESVHERLFKTGTRLTQEQKRAASTTVQPTSMDIAAIQERNKGAEVHKVPTHGLVMVTYAPGKKDQKQDTNTTARGFARNKLGGFFTS